jgi:hypothetical protein
VPAPPSVAVAEASGTKKSSAKVRPQPRIVSPLNKTNVARTMSETPQPAGEHV